MSAKAPVGTFKKYRSYAKWPTLLVSAVLVLTSYVIETTFVDYSHLIVDDRTPDVLGKLFACSFLLTSLLAIFTFLRWYSFVALAALVWVCLVGMGR